MLLIQNHFSDPCNSIGIVLKYWVEKKKKKEKRTRVRVFRVSMKCFF